MSESAPDTANAADRTATPIVDASAHVFFQGNQELRDWLDEPFKSRGFPDVEMDWYGAPGSEYAEGVTMHDGEHPGSVPETVARHLFEDRGVDIAILHPMTRGTLPDRHLSTALLSAHNRMLTERWLDHPTYGERFRGTVRVNPEDIDGALREIDRWADHPRMVQLGIPLQSRDLYGKPQFMPLWRAAADRGLPIAVHIETGTGVGSAPTPSGHPRTYAQYAGFMALNYLYHLMNMIAEGVFETLPDLRVVWADGGAELLTPFMWRMDTFGRPHLEQTPWAPQIPSAYLDRIRFIHSNLDGVGTAGVVAEWLQMTGKEDLIMFGSSYPHWSMLDAQQISRDLTDDQRQNILWRNADALYGLGLASDANAAAPSNSAV